MKMDVYDSMTEKEKAFADLILDLTAAVKENTAEAKAFREQLIEGLDAPIHN